MNEPSIIEKDYGLETLNILQFTFSLQFKCAPDGTTLYRWRRSDGAWASPEMSDVDEALAYPQQKGFIPQ